MKRIETSGINLDTNAILPAGELIVNNNGKVFLHDGTTAGGIGLGSTKIKGNRPDIITSIPPSELGSSGMDIVFGPSNQDDAAFSVNLPFSVSFAGALHSTIWISSNSYVVFEDNNPSANWIPPGNNSFAEVLSYGHPLIMIDGRDNSYQTVFTATENAGTTFRIRWEGTDSTVGTPGNSNMIWEMVFYANDPSRLDLHIISNARNGSGTTIVSSGTANLGTFNPLAGNSYKIYSDYVGLEATTLKFMNITQSEGEITNAGNGVVEVSIGNIYFKTGASITEQSVESNRGDIIIDAERDLRIKTNENDYEFVFDHHGKLSLPNLELESDNIRGLSTGQVGLSYTFNTTYDSLSDNGGASGVNLAVGSDSTAIQVGWVAHFQSGETYTVETVDNHGDYMYIGMNGGTAFSASLPVTINSSDYVPAPDPELNVEVGSNTWTFQNDGKLKLPAGGDIVDSSNNSVLGGGGNTGDVTFSGAVVIGDGQLGLAANSYEFDAGRYLRVRSGDQESHIHFDTTDNSSYDLYLGDDSRYVRVARTGEIVIGVDDAYEWNESSGKRWKFNTDGTLTTPGYTLPATDGTAGQVLSTDGNGTVTWADASGGTSVAPYKGFKAHYGRMYNNNDDPNGPINKLVIYKDTVTPSSTIDTSTSNDTFTVTGLTGSDVVAMLVTIGQNINATPTDELKTFVESVIDNVILDGGIEGQVNNIDDMKTAFYSNFNTFSSTLSDLKDNFNFLTNQQLYYNIVDFGNNAINSGSGSGLYFNSVYYNPDTGQIEPGSSSNGGPGGYQVNDTITIPGTSVQDYMNNTLASPANDLTITINQVDSSGIVQVYSITGTLPYTTLGFPSNSISDGGSDEYDDGNYINTDLESNISYNNGIVVNSSSSFGGGNYVVTYQDSIFGVFVTNANINSIGTDGNSGFDGNGVADTGDLYVTTPSVTTPVITWTNPNSNVWRIEEYNGGIAVSSYNGNPELWWDINNSDSGSDDFRGAIIQYHAFVQSKGTIIGTIHVASDYSVNGATHTEHLSGNSDLNYVSLWEGQGNNGRLYFKMTNGDNRDIMIQWTSKVFYGNEFYC